MIRCAYRNSRIVYTLGQSGRGCVAVVEREVDRMKLLRQWKKGVTWKQGATMVEYGLIVALIAVALIFMVGFLGTQLQATFLHIGNELGK